MKPNQLFRREPFIEMVQHTAEEQLSLVHVYLYSTLFRDDSGFQLEELRDESLVCIYSFFFLAF